MIEDAAHFSIRVENDTRLASLAIRRTHRINQYQCIHSLAIHNQCVRFGEHNGFINYVDGANIAGFRKVAEAMLDQGLT